MRKSFKRAASLALAAFMAVPAGIYAYADDAQFSEEVKNTLAMVKSRIEIPKECTKFSYERGTRGFVNTYSFTWDAPDGEDYHAVCVSAYDSIITSYEDYSAERWGDYSAKLADMSKDELYNAAVKWVKTLNPTISDNIVVDKGSMSTSPRTKYVDFTLKRMANGVPVASDTGVIELNKDTGELVGFRLGWHPKAAFQKTDKAVSAEKARKSYEDMIALEPVYNVRYDYEIKDYTAQLVYRQTDYGEINAFTGKKNNFEADGYYENGIAETEEAAADLANPTTGGDAGVQEFSKEELAELDKELPYSTEDAIKKLVQDNPYLTWSDDFVLQSSRLRKTGSDENPVYVYTVSFSTEQKEDYWEEPMPIEETVSADFAVSEPYEPDQYMYMSISVNAETGNVTNYSYSYSDFKENSNYDMTAANKKASDVVNSLAPDVVKEYTEREDNENFTTDEKGVKKYYGSGHDFIRTANGIKVAYNDISVSFDADMTLTYYINRYEEVEFPDPKDMLTADEVMDVFWKTHDFNMYYLVRTGKTLTASTLVYGTDDSVYADAFTGKQIYDWSENKCDISGIKDKKLRKTAELLLDNGVEISEGKFSENDTVNLNDFSRVVNIFSNSRIYAAEEYPDKEGDEVLLTNGEAMRLLVKAEFGAKFAELEGIFKSPFDNIKDNDPNAGIYAAAWAMGAVDKSEKTLDTEKAYTYADLITLAYSQLSQK